MPFTPGGMEECLHWGLHELALEDAVHAWGDGGVSALDKNHELALEDAVHAWGDGGCWGGSWVGCWMGHRGAAAVGWGSRAVRGGCWMGQLGVVLSTVAKNLSGTRREVLSVGRQQEKLGEAQPEAYHPQGRYTLEDVINDRVQIYPRRPAARTELR